MAKTKSASVTTKTKVPKAKKTTSKPITEKTNEKCIWTMGSPCRGPVSKVEMFDHQIKIPICSKHVEEHAEIMLLHKNGYDVEEILNQTPEWRKQEVLTLKLSGLDSGDVEL